MCKNTMYVYISNIETLLQHLSTNLFSSVFFLMLGIYGSLLVAAERGAEWPSGNALAIVCHFLDAAPTAP